jgi:hypothetical protein
MSLSSSERQRLTTDGFWRSEAVMLKLFLAAALAMPTAALAQDIHLVCEGTASIQRNVRVGTYSDSGQGSDNTGGTFNYSGSGSVNAREMVSEDDEIMVDVTGTDGRVKIPDRWLPPLHTSSADGWRTLSSLTVSDTEIRGRFEINFLLRPTLVISRLTGRIDVVGQGRFAGECQPYQPGAAARRF